MGFCGDAPVEEEDEDKAARKFLNVLFTDSSSSSLSSFKESWLTRLEDRLERMLPLDEASLLGRSESLFTPESAREEELLAPELLVGDAGGDMEVT